jgi:ATP-binding cassette subfamily B multidrug efflux pump
MEQASTRIRAYDEDAHGYRLSFVGLYKPYFWLLLLGLVWLLCTNLAAAFLPRFVNRAVNQIVHPATTEQPIWLFVVLIMSLAAIAAVFRTLSRREIFNIGRLIERDARRHLFSQLILQSRSFFRKKSVGDLMNHSLGDVTNIRLTVGFAMLNLFNIVLVTVINVPLLVAINTKIALWAMSPFVLVMIVARVFSAQMFKGVTANQEAQSRVSAHVQENLSGAQVVRLFGREDFEAKKFKSTNYNAYVKAMKLAWVRTVVFPLTRAMGGLGVAVVLFVGGTALHNGEITIGDFIEVNTRLLMLSWPAISVGLIISIFAQGRASLERINKLVEQDAGTLDGKLSPEIKGDVDIQDIRVENILGPITASIKSPSLIGIVGPSGSGKSTLVSCLLRQEERMQGEVLFDGINAKEFRLNALFSQVAAVLPEPFLFGDTMRTNLCFAKPDATDDEIAEVVKIVGLDDDIARMEKGMSTLVGEKGVMLSGGQRQRVALARALLAKPKVLLLDDCFSAVDAETESHIVEALRKNRFAPTVILVSHRLAAMRYVDDIWVLDRGVIVERGHHSELLEKGRVYPLLWGVESLNQQLVSSTK